MNLADACWSLIQTAAPAQWWGTAARAALAAGRYQTIMSRDGGALYLLRMWLTTPQPGPDGRFDSGNSVLLHAFARPDDDHALHDHPWDFATQILQGGYDEALPPQAWLDDRGAMNDVVRRALPGPAYDARLERRTVGDRVWRRADQLHAVARLHGTTWTLVTTGLRAREWGFHPPGGPWQPYRQFLGLAAA